MLGAGRSGALGIIAGGCVHIGFATVGLSALIVRSALLFATLKYVGAGAGTPSRGVRAGFRYATAAVFLGLGIRVALPESR